jgi:hypothetical protein
MIDVEVVNDPDPAANTADPAEFAGFSAGEGFVGYLGRNKRVTHHKGSRKHENTKSKEIKGRIDLVHFCLAVSVVIFRGFVVPQDPKNDAKVSNWGLLWEAAARKGIGWRQGYLSP